MISIAAFFRPGFWEIVLIALVIAAIFGAKRLPDIGRAAGRAIRNFQRSLKGEGGDADEGNKRNE